MSVISSVSVDFIANVAKYTAGLDTMSKKTKTWSNNTKKETRGATDAFDGVSKALNKFATQVISVAVIQKVGAAFVQVAKDVSLLADEAEKVGANAGQFAALDLAAKKNGASISDVKVAYKELQKSVNEALNGNKETVQSFKDLGLSYNYIAKLSPDYKFLAVADALSRVTDENKRAEIGTRLLGKAYTELSPLIAKGAYGINVAGAGALSEKDVQTIDKVTKAFEGVGKAIDTEFKQAIVALAPALMSIAEIANIILNNWGKVSLFFAALSPTIKGYAANIVKYIGSAFSPIYFKEFAAAGGPILAAFFANIADKFGALAESGGRALIIFGSIGQKVFAALTAAVFSLSVAFSSFGIGVVIIGGTLAASFMTGLVAMEGLFNGLASAMEFFNKNSEVAKEFREAAANYQKTREDIVAKLAGIDRTGETPEILAQRMKAANYQIAQDAEKAGKALDAETEKINKLKEEAKKMLEEITTFGASTTKDVMTPFEKADAEFNKLTLAFDIGTITITDYIRAVEKLRDSLNRFDLAKLRAIYQGGPFGALGTNKDSILKDVSGLPDQKVYSKTRLEPLGNLSLMGMDKPVYNTAGEKVFLDLVTQSTFATADLTKSTLDLQAAREKATAMAPALYESTRTETELLKARVEEIKIAASATDEYGNKIINAEVASRALAKAQSDLFAVTTPYFKEAVEFTEKFADGLANAIASGQNFGDALKNVFQDVLKQIAVLIIRTTILQAIMATIGLASAPAALAFGQMTGIVGKAAGGPVNAGSPYMVGEVGPELFVPRSNGVIVPNDMMGRESTQVVQNINISTGVSQTVRYELMQMLPAIKQQAVSAVLDTKSRGGTYARNLAAA